RTAEDGTGAASFDPNGACRLAPVVAPTGTAVPGRGHLGGRRILVPRLRAGSVERSRARPAELRLRRAPRSAQRPHPGGDRCHDAQMPPRRALPDAAEYAIENPNGLVGHFVRHVRRWRAGRRMLVRWSAAAVSGRTGSFR